MVYAFNVANAIDCLTLGDGIDISADIISKAKNNVGEAFHSIGYKYEDGKQDYSKAMAWYRLAANQNNSLAYNNIGCMYFQGLGVSQDYLTAMEYFLKAARVNENTAMLNIGLQFLDGRGVSIDKYKSLEWYIKSGKQPEQVQELNQAGFHLREEDKNKTIYQLINKTEDIVREARMKRESELKEENDELKTRESKSKVEIQKLMKMKLSNEQEVENLRKEHQTLQIESQEKQQQIFALEHEKELLKQSSSSSDQHLKDKDEIIKALRLTTDTLQSLVQTKANENNVLNKDIQRLNELEQMNRELNCKIQEYRKVIQESISLRDIVGYEIVSTNDSAKNKNDAIINTKDEETQKKRHYF